MLVKLLTYKPDSMDDKYTTVNADKILTIRNNLPFMGEPRCTIHFDNGEHIVVGEWRDSVEDKINEKASRN